VKYATSESTVPVVFLKMYILESSLLIYVNGNYNFMYLKCDVKTINTVLFEENTMDIKEEVVSLPQHFQFQWRIKDFLPFEIKLIFILEQYTV